MTSFILVKLIVALCCVCSLGIVCAGASINADSMLSNANMVAKAASIADTASQITVPSPRRERRGRRSTSVISDVKGMARKTIEAFLLMAKRTQIRANWALSEGADTDAFLEELKVLTGFSNSAVRSVTVTTNSLFETLNGPLIYSFKHLWTSNPLNIGDIISCRMSINFAEHYMMVWNETHVIEVANPKGTPITTKGLVSVMAVNETKHYKSDQCLYHKNPVVEAAISCDEETDKGKANKKQVKLVEQTDHIMKRCISTAKGLTYSVLNCNCQDLVLYWAYGLVINSPCIAQFFQDGIIKEKRSIQELEHYVKSPCKDKAFGK